MGTGTELRQDVLAELDREPSVDERRVGVAVSDGIVTLSGAVGSFAEKWNAERAVERVDGVRGIANQVEVQFAGERTDTDVAKAAADALAWNSMVAAEAVTVRVESGWITLRGEVEHDFQRRAAERAVRCLEGVRGVTNLITVLPEAEASGIKREIERTFQRQTTLDAEAISIVVNGAEVELRGQVRSWAERYEAERVAWSAPGVASVRDHITVSPPTASP
jgi:osmotically-inducible protein OsmY